MSQTIARYRPQGHEPDRTAWEAALASLCPRHRAGIPGRGCWPEYPAVVLCGVRTAPARGTKEKNHA